MTSFRDFGILPTGLRAPAGRVRAEFAVGALLGQFIGTGLALLLSLGIAGRG